MKKGFNMSLIAKKIIEAKTSVIHILKGITPKNEPFFAYILFPNDVFELIRDKLSQGQISNISDYGMVLYLGYGNEIPDGLNDNIINFFEANFTKKQA